jgi:hypothetical protein
MIDMSDAIAADRKATREEVLGRAEAIRRLALDLGLAGLRLRDDGTVIIHSDEPGYQVANRLSLAASRTVGAYVHVITDDVPGAASAHEL